MERAYALKSVRAMGIALASWTPDYFLEAQKQAGRVLSLAESVEAYRIVIWLTN